MVVRWAMCVVAGLWALGLQARVLTIEAAALSPVGQPLAAQAVSLPDGWERQGRHGTWRYQARFAVPSAAAEHEPWSLFIPRAGNRFEVHLNGRAVARFGSFANDASDYATRPQHVALPVEWLVDGDNLLTLTVQGDKTRYAGLSQMFVGPAHEVGPMFTQREILQTWSSFATVICAVVLGVLSGALARLVNDRTLVLFALACGLCALRTCYALVITPPVDYRLWNWLLDSCYAGYLACLCCFVTRVVGLRSRLIRAATSGLLGATAVLVPLHAFGGVGGARQAWTMLMVVYATSLCLLVIRAWYRRRTPVNAVLAAAGAASVALAIYDHVLVFYSRGGYGAFALARYSLLLFMLAMAGILVLRYVEKVRQEKVLRAQLAEDLRRKTAELSQQFEARQRQILQAAQQEERRKLVQDLHDSMGLQLSGLLAMVEHGDIQRQPLMREVRTTIEQMRMLVDGGDDFDGDLAQLLGHVRYRLQTRLQRCGIQLDWQAQLDDRLPLLDAARALTLQRILFELCTNVIRHAQAQRVTVRIGPADGRGALHLSFLDDGIGFDVQAATPGVGTVSLHRRIREFGGTLAVRADGHRGTAYAIELPLMS